MSSLSLASRQAGPASRAICRNWWDLLPWSSHQLTRRRSHHFPVIAASGFWVSGGAVLAVLPVGAGHVALNQIPTISASAGVDACWASSAATTQTGSLPIACV